MENKVKKITHFKWNTSQPIKGCPGIQLEKEQGKARTPAPDDSEYRVSFCVCDNPVGFGKVSYLRVCEETEGGTEQDRHVTL